MKHTYEKLEKVKALISALNDFEEELDQKSWDPVLKEFDEKFFIMCNCHLDNHHGLEGSLYDFKWNITHLSSIATDMESMLELFTQDVESIKQQFERATQ